MNFRNLRYFLAVCEMGTIKAAAKKLYISQQSLSQNIKNLEDELDIQLFYRETPVVLTEAGKCFQSTAVDILERLDRMDRELSAIKGNTVQELTIGTLDYGIPDFLPPLLDEFIIREPQVLIKTREIPPDTALPRDCPLFISARELNGYKNDVLLYDRLVVCVSDALLQRYFGAGWEARKARLEQGDLHALKGCPFVQHRGTPLEGLSSLVFDANGFTPDYLPVQGGAATVTNFCANGNAAAIMLYNQCRTNPSMPPSYLIKNVPETIPTAFICYRSDAVLPNIAQRFLDLTRRYFTRFGNNI